MIKSFLCPVCGQPLQAGETSFFCSKNHQFDRAKSGYVNLLLHKHSNVPGDNKLMVSSRKQFLQKGYYQILADKLCEEIQNISPIHPMIVDAGCGEGYYTNQVYQALQQQADIFGIDISKFALNAAAKKNPQIHYAVASVFHLPISDHCCDIVLNLFAPYCGEEFQRILKSNGYLFLIIPGKEHLWELKQAIYDTPYFNEVKDYALEGFQLQKVVKINDTIFLNCAEDIQNLFTMTPYYYKTSIESTKRLQQLHTLETKIQFELLIYQLKS